MGGGGGGGFKALLLLTSKRKEFCVPRFAWGRVPIYLHSDYLNCRCRWTSLTYISELLHEWTVNASSRPASGSLVKLITHDGHSSTSIC